MKYIQITIPGSIFVFECKIEHFLQVSAQCEASLLGQCHHDNNNNPAILEVAVKFRGGYVPGVPVTGRIFKVAFGASEARDVANISEFIQFVCGLISHFTVSDVANPFAAMLCSSDPLPVLWPGSMIERAGQNLQPAVPPVQTKKEEISAEANNFDGQLTSAVEWHSSTLEKTVLDSPGFNYAAGFQIALFDYEKPKKTENGPKPNHNNQWKTVLFSQWIEDIRILQESFLDLAPDGREGMYYATIKLVGCYVPGIGEERGYFIVNTTASDTGNCNVAKFVSFLCLLKNMAILEKKSTGDLDLDAREEVIDAWDIAEYYNTGPRTLYCSLESPYMAGLCVVAYDESNDSIKYSNEEANEEDEDDVLQSLE